MHKHSFIKPLSEDNSPDFVSLEELQEQVELHYCPECGQELSASDSDSWGLCPSCQAELTPDTQNPEKPLDFNPD